MTRMLPLACVTGRFQPVHEQHLELFDIALGRCEHLIVAVTNPDSETLHEERESAHRHTPAANPFSYYERGRLIGAAAADRGIAGRCTLVPFDMLRPGVWPQYVPLTAHHFVRVYGERSAWERRKVQRLKEAGYGVTVLEGDPALRVCASHIRGRMRAGDEAWRSLVPAATRALLDDLLVQTPMRARG